MPTRSVTAAAVALALVCVCPAYADTNVTVHRAEAPAVEDTKPTPDAFRVGEVTHGRIAKTKITSSRITIEIAGTSYVAAAVDVPLALALGTRVTGMTVTTGKETVRAEMLAANDGHKQYFDIVRRGVDPALLEYTMTTSTSELATLRVFPVTTTQHATVTLELGRSDDDAIDDQHSLFATGSATAPGMRAPVVFIDCGSPHSARDIDKSIIRRYVKQHMERLAGCYRRQLLAHPTLAGTADLHFTIRPTGRVEEISVDGTLESEAVHDCLVEELLTWTFSPTDGNVQVNYPLTFQVAGTEN